MESLQTSSKSDEAVATWMRFFIESISEETDAASSEIDTGSKGLV